MQQEQEQEQDLSKVTIGITMPLLINTLSEFLGGVGATPLPFNVRVNGLISFPRQPRMAAWQSKDHQ